MHGSISIAVSDDGSDGRKKPRFRRARRKPHAREGFLRRASRFLLRWWLLPLLIAAVFLLVFEASRLSSRSVSPGKETRFPVKNNEAGEEEAKGNLNRLDPTTRVVRGVRERCLKLLPPNELQNLEFPQPTLVDYPVKRVVYGSAVGNQTDDDTHRQVREGTRFNLFTGFQTIQERDESFKGNETAIVHCGFFSDNGGFRVSVDDKVYMQTCKAVVSTCAFGGGDSLYQPIGMTDTSLRKVCYVAFWDEITRASQEAEGKIIGDNNMIGKWHIILVKNLPFADQRLNGKIPKMLSHRLFPQARYSIWVDSKSQFRRDPLGVIEALLWRTNSILAISEHGARSSVYDEGKAVVKKNKAAPEEVEIQLKQYKHDGFADIKRFNGKKALSEASVIVREHTPQTNLLMCTWFNEVVRFTSRDQLSFPYVLRRLNIPGIHMFPVCTRKDLVNSMGHKRKVKPLVT